MGCGAYGQEWRSREKTCFRLCFLVCTSLLLANPARAPRAKSAGEMRLARADRRTRPRSAAPVRSAQDGERMGNSWWGRAGSSQKDGGGNSRSRCSLIVEADVPSFKTSPRHAILEALRGERRRLWRRESNQRQSSTAGTDRRRSTHKRPPTFENRQGTTPGATGRDSCNSIG